MTIIQKITDMSDNMAFTNVLKLWKIKNGNPENNKMKTE